MFPNPFGRIQLVIFKHLVQIAMILNFISAARVSVLAFLEHDDYLAIGCDERSSEKQEKACLTRTATAAFCI